jgi:dihydrofolate reductase
LEHYGNETERTVFIIGGGQIYKEALLLDEVDEMYITHVDVELDADTFFPTFEINKWNVETLVKHEVDEKNEYPFEIKKYTKN